MDVEFPALVKLHWLNEFQVEKTQIQANKAAVNVENVADALYSSLKEVDQVNLRALISSIPKVMKLFRGSVKDNAGDRDTAVRIVARVVDKAEELGQDAVDKAFIKGVVEAVAEKILHANAKQFQVNDGGARNLNPDLSGENLDAWTTQQADALALLFIAGEGQNPQVTPGAITNAVQRAMELVEKVGAFADNNEERKAAAVQIVLKAAHAAAGVAGLPDDKIDGIVTPIANTAIEVFIKASKGGYGWLNEALLGGAEKLDSVLAAHGTGSGNSNELELDDDLVPVDDQTKKGKGKDGKDEGSGSGSGSKSKCCVVQ
ncbi:MAG: hypothetical protein Q8K75_00330 [Chlamydiales bacterium]|nr:hypothetical protein [Chlamydiales bacterium]